ncbi:hypothetical protein EW146_g8295 [Bondarzewia mesenterica]|uniref:Integrase core domain-containing protein n=1 Tax=Bondarzewia mesenterica TaxID=1095465 RepID=A0A4S4LHC5_9AGAM|nr:hypothetical protein EW146_g8295 [Bondarzewia mesenterica]
MPDQLHNIHAAYDVLCNRVIEALFTQVGDWTRLDQQRNQVLQLLHAAEQHRHLIPSTEYRTLKQSVADIVEALDDADQQSSDPQEGPSFLITTQTHTGRRGCPRIQIDCQFFAQALELCGPFGLAPIFQCNARMIRHHALEHGLVQPGTPVYHQPNGTIERSYSSTTPPVSTMSNAQLDDMIAHILDIFLNFGRCMLSGCLRAQGHRVPTGRIAASYVCVHGSPAIFGDRRIHRKVYNVPRPNSLWHHDGQHGLIRWKLVKHCFVDGKTRLVVGIRVNNNNCSTTILDLFLSAIPDYGIPSRVRGDHGMENVKVVEWMEQNRRIGRGSYIWGRSVHNTRIERLWYDITQGFGQKWKNFFLELEHHYGLDPDRPAHIWLLYHLFLATIDSIEGYGIDWDVIDNPMLMMHFLQHNVDEWDNGNPFTATTPDRMAEVVCEPPNCPFSPEKVAYIDQELHTHFDSSSHNMHVHRLIWYAITAFLAYACIGAIHSVVFSGLSAESPRDRVLDCKSKVLLTSNEGKCSGKTIATKAIIDITLKAYPHIEHVLVLKCTGNPIN